MPRPRLFLLLERASHAVRQRLERHAQDELGASMAQIGALFHLTQHDGCLSKELADALGVQAAAITGLVDRMASAGLLQRRACPDDGRAQRLHLTASGRRIAARAAPSVHAMQGVLAEGFSADELEVVARFLTAAAERALWPLPSARKSS